MYLKPHSTYAIVTPALGPTQLPVQWVPGNVFPGLNPKGGTKLTIHIRPVPILTMIYVSLPLYTRTIVVFDGNY
jgi:hypothetical protein